jgi:hypothetical protein
MTEARCESRQLSRTEVTASGAPKKVARCDLPPGHGGRHRHGPHTWHDDGLTAAERLAVELGEAEPHHRGSLDLPDACWDFVDRIAERDGVTRAFFVEGLILLAMDREEADEARRLHERAEAIRARQRRQLRPVQ